MKLSVSGNKKEIETFSTHANLADFKDDEIIYAAIYECLLQNLEISHIRRLIKYEFDDLAHVLIVIRFYKT